jgi:RNA polymerase sigma-70 factor (ECF subfamily)
MNTTPVSLLERLRHDAAGGCEPVAWRRFTDLYTPLLYYWARRLGLQESDAADLVQDVFLKLIRKLPEFSYQRGRSFRSWLRAVLVNQWRTSQRRRVVVAAAGGDALDEVAAGDESDALGEEEYRQYVAQRALRLMQSQFQPATWRACWLQVVDGRSAAEVAAELGISEGAAYVAKCRVLRRLRQDLDGLLD